MTSFQRRDVNMPAKAGTIIDIVAWILLALVVTTLIARLAVKLSRRTKRTTLAWDDVFLVLAAFFSFGQTIAISIQWRDQPSDVQPEAFNKAVYASSILFIANMGCAKISIGLVIRKLFSGRLFEYTSTILAVSTAGWTISGVLVIAFQCQLPAPWNVVDAHCIDIAAFGNYLASTNIVTEIVLVLVPLAVWIRGIAVGNRLYIYAVFFSRLSIIAAVSLQLYFFDASALSTPTTNSWNTTLCMQIAQTLSVISACLPGLHPLVAKDLSDTASSHSTHSDNTTRWDAKKFGSLSSHSSHPSTDTQTTPDPAPSPYCRPLVTHGLVRSTPRCDSYSFPRMSTTATHHLPTPTTPKNIFNRLVGTSNAHPGSSTLDLDPLGLPHNLSDLGCLPPSPWDEDVEAGTASPDQQSTGYVFDRSKVISVPEDASMNMNMLEIGDEWRRFVPPLPSPQVWGEPPRAF